jgi:hypothetical protein
MKKYAHIENNAVVEIIETDGDITQMFHPDLKIVECDDGVSVGDCFDGDKFSPPVEILPTIEERRKSMILTRVNAKLRLIDACIYNAVNDAIAASGNLRMQILWADAPEFHRNDLVLCDFLTNDMKLTDEQIDGLFL